MNAVKHRTNRINSRASGWLWAAGAVALVVAAVAIISVRASNPPETGPMGGLLYEAESQTTGVATAGELVVEGAEIALGHVPLNVTVVPEWTITNTGEVTVALGEPHASVVEGCCPGPLELTAATLAPGETARLTFPLQMHPGMDGPHDFDIHLPLAVSDEYLTLGVTGDFS